VFHARNILAAFQGLEVEARHRLGDSTSPAAAPAALRMRKPEVELRKRSSFFDTAAPVNWFTGEMSQ